MRFYCKKITSRAVTLTELLVVLVIISLLATIAIPVYVNRAQQARITTAQREVREIAEALKACALVHEFYVPLQVLDDLHPNVNLTSVIEDDLENESDSTIHLIDATQDPELQIGAGQLTLQNRSTNPRVASLFNFWAGPFLNTQRYHLKQVLNPSNSDVRDDLPLDPWGQPYRLWSPLGVVGDNAQDPSISGFTDTSFNGALTRNLPHYDRYAVVSYGPDGVTGSLSSSNRNDDIRYLFGALLTESSFAAFR